MTAEVIGELAASGVIVMFVMSLLKDVGRAWATQVKRAAAVLLAGAATALVVGASELGWDTFTDYEGLKLFVGAWSIAYTSMQVNYSGWFETTRLNMGLEATGAKAQSDVIEY
jgi:hypothetical protein